MNSGPRLCPVWPVAVVCQGGGQSDCPLDLTATVWGCHRRATERERERERERKKERERERDLSKRETEHLY